MVDFSITRMLIQSFPYETERRKRHGSGTAKTRLGHGNPYGFCNTQNTDTESKSERERFLHAESHVKKTESVSQLERRNPCLRETVSNL